MKRSGWIILFIIFLLVDIYAVYLNNETLRYVTKPLLMPLLIGHFYFNTNSFSSILKKWIILALIFSWLGDVLLMFESVNSNFFIYGLIAFLIAHIFYILYFDFVIQLEKLRKKYWIFIPVLAYYVLLISLLSPALGDMRLPVRIYGVVISYMLIQSFQTARIQNKRSALLLIVGAILFIGSDSVLAINKFYQPFEYAGLVVMTTYGLAQLLLTIGAANYLTSGPKQ